MRALLDVNALIALIDEEHIHHAQILEWLQRDEHLLLGFATCAITQLGLIRVMRSKGYFKSVEPPTFGDKARPVDAQRTPLPGHPGAH